MNSLQRARVYLGYTQPQMAEALGISRATYQRRERLADDYIKPPERLYVAALVAEAQRGDNGYPQEEGEG